MAHVARDRTRPLKGRSSEVGEAEDVVGSFELMPTGPYSLAASAKFLEGFAPAAYDGGGVDHLRFAFVADGGGDEVAGVYLREEDGSVVGEVYGGADVEVVRRQVARILSLDADGSGFPGWGSGTRS